MGLVSRRKSGNIIGGSRLVVPGQPIFNVKKFEVTFNKKGSLPDETREVNPPKPPSCPCIPPTPFETFYILTENLDVIITQMGDKLVWTY